MLQLAKTILFIFLVWITAFYSANDLKLPLGWWLVAIIIVVIQVVQLKKETNIRILYAFFINNIVIICRRYCNIDIGNAYKE
ncbi:MAG: hypothetical protein WCO23_00620 [bacterium]